MKRWSKCQSSVPHDKNVKILGYVNFNLLTKCCAHLLEPNFVPPCYNHLPPMLFHFNLSQRKRVLLKTKVFFAYFANGWVCIVVRKLKTRKMSDLLCYLYKLACKRLEGTNMVGYYPSGRNSNHSSISPSLLTLLLIHGKTVWGSTGRNICLHKNFGTGRLW